MDLADLTPSQLFLNQDKIKTLENQINPFALENIPPISIRKFGEKTVFLDGHTRAFLASKNGLKKVPVYWETEEYDWKMYEICIQWCQDEKIFHVEDLKHKIVDTETYEKCWIGKCQALSRQLEEHHN
ncbi:hypothetical protein NEF87_003795 [Candidatus Lokiarchaeum ossiferum]|uniref:ParB/Sulfiredoxin domain-containing protein n=1 Tax=Candidatus Lokiarchaeum ossiferum TaxID=2951803 RepID=A0ABY6HVS2_9ARCH|nr:hypothetical protein NEF87_003795 [Candidatus Lokiarchaeum sp. B-35]